MFKILTKNKIAECGLEQLPASRFTVSDTEAAPEGILMRSYNLPESELNDNLLAIGRAGAGVNNIPVAACSEKGIVVFNSPGANANAVKELVLAGMIAASRNLVDGANWAQTLKGQTGVAALVEKGKNAFVGTEIYGKTIGFIGLGAIGGLLANACYALGMQVLGYDPYISVDAAWSLSRGVRRAADIDSVVATADFLSLNALVTPETKGMVNRDFLAKCKKGVCVLNFARSELVNADDMLAALNDGTVSSYVVDLPTDEMLGHPKILAIPHLGASSLEAEDNCAIMAAAELREYLLCGNIKNAVNFPECNLPYSPDRKRICVIHRNVAKIIGPLTTLFADRTINIYNMINKSRGDFAYTIIDVDTDNVDGIEASIGAMDNILRVRVI